MDVKLDKWFRPKIDKEVLKELTKKINSTDYAQKSQAFGVLIEGQFTSVFDNRIPPLRLDDRIINGNKKV